jgi:diketogulonate reductase-like aldo/keto reductase
MGERKIAQGQADKADKLKPIAEELSCSLAQLALAWCVRNKNVSTVITGSTKVHQVRGGALLWHGYRVVQGCAGGGGCMRCGTSL